MRTRAECHAKTGRFSKAESDPDFVTPSRPSPLSAAERKRRQRERERMRQAGGEPPVLFENEDWQLFLDWDTLPQKAGCYPHRLPEIVIKELVDNALDAGARVTLYEEDGAWIVTDDGPGLDPADVPRLFTVRRPLRSSKRGRRPLRGMLGNGLRVVAGAVAATGSLSRPAGAAWPSRSRTRPAAQT